MRRRAALLAVVLLAGCGSAARTVAASPTSTIPPAARPDSSWGPGDEHDFMFAVLDADPAQGIGACRNTADATGNETARTTMTDGFASAAAKTGMDINALAAAFVAWCGAHT